MRTIYFNESGAEWWWADTVGAAHPPTVSEPSDETEPRQSPRGQARRAAGAEPLSR
jgi:hypothetical protein